MAALGLLGGAAGGPSQGTALGSTTVASNRAPRKAPFQATDLDCVRMLDGRHDKLKKAPRLGYLRECKRGILRLRHQHKAAVQVRPLFDGRLEGQLEKTKHRKMAQWLAKKGL